MLSRIEFSDWTAMTFTLRIGVPAWLSCAVLLFAQDGTRSSDQKFGPPATPEGKSSQAQPSPQGPVEILTDTRGVDFGPYLARVLHDVRNRRYRVIPDSARAPIMKKGHVLIGFRIMKDGAIGDLHDVQSSGAHRTRQRVKASLPPHRCCPCRMNFTASM
jgi:hypothetical protein